MTLPDALPFTITVDDLPGPDFTTYLKIKPESRTNRSKSPSGARVQPSRATATSNGTRPVKKTQYSQEGSFEITHAKDKNLGRGLKCRAYGNTYWSITLRCSAKNTRHSSNKYLTRLANGLRKYAASHPKKLKLQDSKPDDYLGYFPAGFDTYSRLFRPEKPIDPKADIFLNDIYQVCLQLRQILFAKSSPSGLITVTGATDSSKSLVTRGLIFLHLEAVAKEALKKKLRRPHLVTFEDPIEQYYVKDPDTHSAPKQLEDLKSLLSAVYIDYTPREKKADADALSKVIKDAKRQTPAVFFVGETRDPSDWKQLLQFAGSGHLVITTSHAASVVEAMTQIFRETKTETAAQRSEIARRILGIVNLRSFNPTVPKNTSNVRVLLPAVWKSTSQSINNLVADGLSSMLPALGQEHEIGYYGRTYFARKLIGNCTPGFKNCKGSSELQKEIKRKAMEWDIGGV